MAGNRECCEDSKTKQPFVFGKISTTITTASAESTINTISNSIENKSTENRDIPNTTTAKSSVFTNSSQTPTSTSNLFQNNSSVQQKQSNTTTKFQFSNTDFPNYDFTQRKSTNQAVGTSSSDENNVKSDKDGV